MNATVYDNRVSTLAEGPLWHPVRKQLFWFDILGKKLHTRDPDGARSWELGEYGSAAGWIDEDALLLATETGLHRFDIASGNRTRIADIEANDPTMRSNDGRADPWGGFWIGTMSKTHEDGAGAFYRYYRGEVRRLFGSISIPNATCFAHDRSYAYFGDTRSKKVMRVALDAESGWPAGEPEIYIDFSSQNVSPDGAVIDADGLVWIAQWGGSRVAAYDAQGTFVRDMSISVPQVTCPAFGGEDFSTLFATTARENMDIETIAKFSESGMVFHARGVARGMPEYQVHL
ncbi:SMP-30/gluconolactonase/LRE family protein [Pelagibacterium limicola]|uniref:SMP-30/gluconolactonase/LRE family protein n=1 Tax=Pelagibacterium limicola TaxID=2791022 RepID=UPI0018AF6DC9|nr:SMP-30/gluconolactonase/LRE family protein [Pelagibacterium limicola]